MLLLFGEPRFQNTVITLERVTYLLALLICKQTWLTRNELVLLFWGDVPEDVGRKRLRQLLYRTRGFEYASGLKIEATRVRFDGQSDVQAFKSAVAEKRFEAAVALYKGDFLHGANLSDLPELEEFFTLEREELARLYRDAVLKAASKLESFQAAAMLETALRLNPLAEDLLEACWEVSDQPQKERAFAMYQQALMGLDLEPNNDWLMKLNALAPQTQARAALHVPLPTTILIGRQSELDLIDQRMKASDCRLITLIGVGGAGKTRLAITVANQYLTKFNDGACFVALAGVNSTDLVPEAILEALGVANSGNAARQLLEVLAELELFLVLDNLEHLPGVNDLVAQILEKCVSIRILTTSREALGLRFEHLIDIEGFPAPDTLFPLETQDAARLFLHAARRVRPGFELEEDFVQFLRIYRAVSGIPLGLELAASWVRILNLEEIAIELESSLDLLTVESKDIPERHRSFAATFRSSWILLSQVERFALARLSVMRGSFSREWALKVSGSSLNVLLKLINKSMVSKRDSRFFLHELIRQYAFAELSIDACNTAMSALSELCLDLSRAWYPERNSIRHAEMSRRVELEIDNLRPTLEWCLNHSPRVGAETTGLLEHFWNTRGYHQEGLRWGLEFKACIETMSEDWVRAHLLWLIASLGKEQSEYDLAREAIVEYQAIGEAMGNIQLRANSQKFLGLIERDMGNLDLAKQHLMTAISLHTDYGNTNQIAMCNNDLGQVLLYQDQLEAAKVCFQNALDLKRSLNDPLGAAYALGHLANVAGLQGDNDLEATLLEESLRVKREVNDVHGIASGLQALGNLARRNNQMALARDYLNNSLNMFLRLGRRWSAAHVLVDFAHLEYGNLQFAKALLLLIASENVLLKIGAKLSDRIQISTAYIRAKHGLSPAMQAKTEIEAHKLNFEQTVQLALESQESDVLPLQV